MHKEAARTGCRETAERVGHTAVFGVYIAVIHPVFEEIPEYVERLPCQGLRFKEVQERICRIRPANVEMQVRNEIFSHRFNQVRPS